MVAGLNRSVAHSITDPKLGDRCKNIFGSALTGAQDNVVPPWFGQQYAEEAKKVGDDVSFVVVDNASHFEVIAPGSVAWPQVEQAVLSMMKLHKGTSK
jgi:hypothetical protein